MPINARNEGRVAINKQSQSTMRGGKIQGWGDRSVPRAWPKASDRSPFAPCLFRSMAGFGHHRGFLPGSRRSSRLLGRPGPSRVRWSGVTVPRGANEFPERVRHVVPPRSYRPLSPPAAILPVRLWRKMASFVRSVMTTFDPRGRAAVAVRCLTGKLGGAAIPETACTSNINDGFAPGSRLRRPAYDAEIRSHKCRLVV